MIDKNIVKSFVEEWLAEKEYFLVDVEISTDNKIVVEIDHADGVWIEDCVELSRYIEDRLDRDKEDYELEVGSERKWRCWPPTARNTRACSRAWRAGSSWSPCRRKFTRRARSAPWCSPWTTPSAWMR